MINAHKTPLLLVAFCLACGILVSSVWASPGFMGLVAAVAMTLVLFLASRRGIFPLAQTLTQTSLYGCFLVAGWVLGEGSAVIPAMDPGKFIGQEMTVTGTITDDVRMSEYGYRTTLDISAPLSGKVVLYLPKTSKAPATNDVVQAQVSLHAHSSKNPGFANWLHHQGIHATGKAREVTKLGAATGVQATLRSIRSKIATQFASVFPSATTAGLSNAMLLGDRSALDGGIRKDFAATGLSHIVAISGMNFAIIYGVLNLLFTPLLHLRRGRQIRSLIVVPMLAFFALLTGGNPAVVRAAIMLGMLDISQAFWAKNNSLNALATSALIFLVADPQSLFTPDFQLSYAAVLGILLLQNPILHYFHRRLPRLPKWLGSGLAVTLAAQIATTPLVAFHFQSFPTYFLLANMIVLPIVTLVVQIGFAGFLVAWIPGVADLWAGIMDFMLWATTSLAHLMAGLPGATIQSLDFRDGGIWILLLQLLLAVALLERKFVGQALTHLVYRKRPLATQLVLSGLQRRMAIVSLTLGWVMLGFLAA